QGCTETGSKKIIQDIAAVRFRIVYKQPGRTASTHRPHAFEHATFVISVDRYYPAGRILSMESAPGGRQQHAGHQHPVAIPLYPLFNHRLPAMWLPNVGSGSGPDSHPLFSPDRVAHRSYRPGRAL